MRKGQVIHHSTDRIFIDSSFHFHCAFCKHDIPLTVANQTEWLSRVCKICDLRQPLKEFKFPHDATYRKVCNHCINIQRTTRYRHKDKQQTKLTYTILPCATCLVEGKNEAEASVMVNSKGAWDEPGVKHKHQERIFKTEAEKDPIQNNL